MSKQKIKKSTHVRQLLSLLIVGFSFWGVVAMSTATVHAAPAVSVVSPHVAQAANACADAQCILDKYVNPAIKVLTACVGVAVVISIIVGGIQYSSAGGDPSKVGAAKGRIAKAIGALVMYIFLYAFLNYIIPGGVK